MRTAGRWACFTVCANISTTISELEAKATTILGIFAWREGMLLIDQTEDT